MATVTGWHIPLGLMALGALFLGVAWLAVTEYWKAFRTDPAAVMSLEVLANILKLGGPGYLAMLTIVIGLPMFLGGTLLLLFLIGVWAIESARTVFHVIGLTFGSS